MESGASLTKFSALTTRPKHFERSRKPDDWDKIISNYIEVYKTLNKFYKFQHIALNLQYI